MTLTFQEICAELQGASKTATYNGDGLWSRGCSSQRVTLTCKTQTSQCMCRRHSLAFQDSLSHLNCSSFLGIFLPLWGIDAFFKQETVAVKSLTHLPSSVLVMCFLCASLTHCVPIFIILIQVLQLQSPLHQLPLCRPVCLMCGAWPGRRVCLGAALLTKRLEPSIEK